MKTPTDGSTHLIPPDRVALAELGLTLAYDSRFSAKDVGEVARRSVATATRRYRTLSGVHTEPLAARYIRSARAALHQREGGPAVICTFHVGQHTLIPWGIAKTGRNINLLVDSSNRSRVLPMWSASSSLTSGRPSEQAVIDAEAPFASLELLRRLQGGESVFLYADGNTGIAQKYVPRTAETLTFGRPSLMRFGFLQIAAVAQVPVHLVIDVGSDRLPRLKKVATYVPRADQTPRAFRERVARQIMAELETLLCRQPYRWEEWHQYPFWLDYEQIVTDAKADLGPERLEVRGFVIEANGTTVVFDRDRMRVFAVVGNVIYRIAEATAKQSGRYWRDGSFCAPNR